MALPVVPASSFSGQTRSFCPPQSFGNQQSHLQRQSSSSLRQQRQPSNYEWELWKADIRRWYIVENRTLKNLGERLCDKHGFRPTVKQLTRRLDQWNFRKNKSRKQTETLSKKIIEAQHRGRFEPTDTHTIRNETDICEAKDEMGMELAHAEVGVKPKQILDICQTKKMCNQDTFTMAGTRFTTHSLQSNGLSHVDDLMTELVQQLSRLNMSFPADTSAFQHVNPLVAHTPKEYLTTEDIRDLELCNYSKEQENRGVFTCTILLGYPQQAGKVNHPLKFRGHDVDFPSSALVPGLSGELYPFPRSPPSDASPSDTSLSSSIPEVEVIQSAISDYLAKFQRLSGAAFPETHPAMIEIMGEIGYSYWVLDKGCESEAWYRRELSSRLASGESPVSAAIFDAELNIIEAVVLQGRYQEAKLLQEKVHQNIVNSEAFSLNRSLVGDSINILGEVLHGQGYKNQAEACFRDVLQIRLNTLGPWHKDTIFAMRKLGRHFTDMKKYEESEEFLKISVHLSSEVLTANSVFMYSAIGDLAAARESRGGFQESEMLYRDLIAEAESALDDTHLAQLNSFESFALSLLKAGRLDEAEQFARKQLDKSIEHLGQDHSLTLHTISLLGDILKDKGSHREAAQCFEKFWQAHSSTIGPDYYNTLWVCNSLAECYDSLGWFENAFQLLGEFVEDVETQVASGNVPCWGDKGLSEAQWWIGYFKEDIENFKEKLQARDTYEIDEAIFSSNYEELSSEGGSSGTEDTIDEGETRTST